MIDIIVSNVTFLIIYLNSKNYVWGENFSSTLSSTLSSVLRTCELN